MIEGTNFEQDFQTDLVGIQQREKCKLSIRVHATNQDDICRFFNSDIRTTLFVLR